MFSHYVNILSGNKTGNGGEEDSPSNAIDVMFRVGVENVTIEQFLSEQECINACKWGNKKLEKL